MRNIIHIGNFQKQSKNQENKVLTNKILTGANAQLFVDGVEIGEFKSVSFTHEPIQLVGTLEPVEQVPTSESTLIDLSEALERLFPILKRVTCDKKHLKLPEMPDFKIGEIKIEDNEIHIDVEIKPRIGIDSILTEFDLPSPRDIVHIGNFKEL